MGMFTPFRIAAALVVLPLLTVPARAVDIQEVTSPNGQVFWLVQEPSIPIVSLEIGFRGGGRLDTPGEAGLTSFTIGLMTEGSGDMDATAWAKRADEISARISISSRSDRVEVSANFLADTLDESTEFLATTLVMPRFDAAAVARVRGQVLSSIASAETDPDQIASNTWWARAFPEHAYGRNSNGTASIVASRTRHACSPPSVRSRLPTPPRAPSPPSTKTRTTTKATTATPIARSVWFMWPI